MEVLARTGRLLHSTFDKNRRTRYNERMLDVQVFLRGFCAWCETQPDIRLAALVGSHARCSARPDSDLDLVIQSSDPERFIQNPGWAEQFGPVAARQVEHWGKVTSLRVWYEDGLEVEYGFAALDWAADLLDEGTRSVIQDGIQILLAKEAQLAAAIQLMQTRESFVR